MQPGIGGGKERNNIKQFHPEHISLFLSDWPKNLNLFHKLSEFAWFD